MDPKIQRPWILSADLRHKVSPPFKMRVANFLRFYKAGLKKESILYPFSPSSRMSKKNMNQVSQKTCLFYLLCYPFQYFISCNTLEI